MLRRGIKNTTQKISKKRTKGSSLLLVPAVLEKKCLLASSAGVRQPWEHAGTSPEGFPALSVIPEALP